MIKIELKPIENFDFGEHRDVYKRTEIAKVEIVGRSPSYRRYIGFVSLLFMIISVFTFMNFYSKLK